MITQVEHISSQPAPEADAEELLTRFDQWATSADRRDDGWEGDFPHWRELMRQAEQIMAQEHLSERALAALDRCWARSHEDEECAYWAREHIDDKNVRNVIFRLTASANPDTRWQAYDVLGGLLPHDSGIQRILEVGMADENSYVRRRAFLPLLSQLEDAAVPHLLRMLADEDSYNRYIAVKEGRQRHIKALQSHIDAAAQDPEVASHLDYYDINKETIDKFDER